MPFLFYHISLLYVAVRCLHNEGMKVELEHYVSALTFSILRLKVNVHLALECVHIEEIEQ